MGVASNKFVTKKDLIEMGGEIVGGPSTHAELVLDGFITEFQHLLEEGTIKINAATGLQAIKIKADMVSKNKDRGVDLVKTFAGMNKNAAPIDN